MAILPRTILTQPAPAAVAAVALFGLTIMGTAAWKTVQNDRAMATYESPCDAVDDQLGARQFWDESSWVRYAYCFEQRGDNAAAAVVAEAGISHYPDSETLYNLAGYNHLEAGEPAEAVEILETGLRFVTPTNGIMENNLSWAYLFVGEGHSEKARQLYLTSLDREVMCESLHTGLFVEFEVARNESGLERAHALRRFQSLRNRYQICENRDGEWMTVVEAVGAAVLYQEVEEMIDDGWDETSDATMRGATELIQKNHAAISVRLLCDEAMPQRDLRDDCREAVQRGLAD